MKNETEQFEAELSRRPLRRVPVEWRGEILAAAVPAPQMAPRGSFLSTLNSRLSDLLWPCPQAWAGLAAVWILILAVNFSMRDPEPMVAKRVSPPSPEMVAELKQQQQMWVELIGPGQAAEAEPAKFLPLPRSERVEFSVV